MSLMQAAGAGHDTINLLFNCHGVLDCHDVPDMPKLAAASKNGMPWSIRAMMGGVLVPDACMASSTLPRNLILFSCMCPGRSGHAREQSIWVRTAPSP